MLSLVRTSLVLVSLLLVLRLSEALPMEEWLLSRSKRIDGVNYEQNPDVQRFDEESVNNEQSLDVQRFDEESYTSLKKVPTEVDQVADVFADKHSENSLPEILRRQYPHRPQCRFAGCGK